MAQEDPPDKESPDETVSENSGTENANGETAAKDESNMSAELQENMENTIVFEIKTTHFYILIASLVVLVASVTAAFFLPKEDQHWRSTPRDFDRIGEDNLALFRKYDVDNDGALSLEEFEPFGHIYLTGSADNVADLSINNNAQIITIETRFKPLVLTSLSSYENNLNEDGKLDEKSYPGLVNWTKPLEELKNFQTSHFSVFVPPVVDELSVGKVHHISSFSKKSLVDDMMTAFYEQLPNNRFYPPMVEDNMLLIHKLLSMLHSRPFVQSRFAPAGSITCVRAFNDEWIDITFRIHAEFQLNEPPYMPFWFTPAQFKGRLIISHDYQEILYFKMSVPNDRRLNVDMEWLKKGEEQMEVDIGFMPLMEFEATAPSRPAFVEGKDMRSEFVLAGPGADVLSEISRWTAEVPEQTCLDAINVEFYPFLAANYLNYTQAYEKAAEENKLVHAIVLWGALDDQSC